MMMKTLPDDLPERLRAWLIPLCAVLLMAGILLGRLVGAMLPCVLATALALAASVAGLALRRTWPLLLLALCGGMLLGYNAWHPAIPESRYYAVTGVVCDEVVQRESDTQIHTWLTDVTLDGEPLRHKAYWSFYCDEIPEGLAPGASVSVYASVYQPMTADNEGGFDFREYCLQHNATVGVYGQNGLICEPMGGGVSAWIARLRGSLSARLCQVMGEEAGGYASAMLLGLRAQVSVDDRESFNSLGIGHILSVSGFHVGVLYGALVLLLRALRIRPRLRPWLAAPILLFYCFLAGGHAPVIRAAILCMVDAVGRSRARTRSALHMLSIAAILQLVWDPVQLTGAGFQLSYGAMLGLTLITPGIVRHDPFGRLNRPRAKKAGHALWTAFAAAAGAQLGVLLPELYWYQELPLLGILCNMLLLTLAGGLLLLYWCCLALMFVPGIGQLLGAAAAWLTGLLLTGVRSFGDQAWMMLWTRQPSAWALGGMALLGLGACCLWPKRKRFHWVALALGAVLVAVSLLPADPDAVTWTQLSAGAADAGILCDGGFTMVVDTGEFSTLASWLHARRRSIDVLVLSHLHSDHIAGLDALLDDRIPIGVCYISVCAEEGDVSSWALEQIARLEERGIPVKRLEAGDEIELPSGKATVLWPSAEHGEPWQDANDGSLVLLCEVRGVRMLLTGDLTSRCENESAVETDILKVAHHGAAQSTSAQYLAQTAPQVLLLSSKQANETRFRKRYPDAEVYGTASQGMLTVRFEGDGRFSVTPYLH